MGLQDTFSVEMKTCSKCQLIKPENAFSKAKKGVNGLRSRCKSCSNEDWKGYYQSNSKQHILRAKQWALANPDKRKKNRKHHNLKTTYGISLEEFNQLLASQSGKCAVCESLLIRPHVDHCHYTKNIRGLLCPGCNVGIGHLKNDPEICRKAALYLESSAAINFIARVPID